MLRRITWLVGFVFIAGMLSFGIASAVEKMMSVQVRKGDIRATPSFLGKILVRLNYGDQVMVLREQGRWNKITAADGSHQGWLHQSSLTPKKIILAAGAADVSKTASSEEVALAGRGFNQQVEDSFRARNRNIDFRWIDRMEQFVVSEADMRKFLKSGRLSPEGGI
jgi:hypothetical protein